MSGMNNGSKLGQLMKEKGITSKWLAMATGIPKDTISRLRQRQDALDSAAALTVLSISYAMRVPIRDLLSVEDLY